MPIPLPNLDDRTYDDLTAQARSLIPALHPGWTDHNPSDPGITLVELLAWLTEMLLFQVNEITPAHTKKFLELLNGVPPGDVDLDAAVRQTVLGLRERYRAVTPEDYEWLTLHAWPRSDAARQLDAAATVLRARCVPRRNLAATDPAARRLPAPAHVSVVIVPGPGKETPGQELRQALWDFLDARRVLTTRHHVTGPEYVPVEIGAKLALHGDAPPETALQLAGQALEACFDPLTGGPEGTGWPFGRPVYASEVYAVLDGVPLVDYVEDVEVSTTAGDDRLSAGGDGLAGVWLDAHELVEVVHPPELVAYDVHGRSHRLGGEGG